MKTQCRATCSQASGIHEIRCVLNVLRKHKWSVVILCLCMAAQHVLSCRKFQAPYFCVDACGPGLEGSGGLKCLMVCSLE